MNVTSVLIGNIICSEAYLFKVRGKLQTTIILRRLFNTEYHKSQ